MMNQASSAVELQEPTAATPLISTGTLPASELVRQLVDQAHATYRDNDEGENAAYYPALAAVPRNLFGICVAGINGSVTLAGDADVPFTIMSVAKPFVFALIAEQLGVEPARAAIGVNATGLAFNSVTAIEQGPGGRTNPMVNAGAIATTSLAPGATAEAQWEFLAAGLARFAGRPLALNDAVYASASASNHRNQAIARLLEGYGRLGCEPAVAVELYTRQSSLAVTAQDLAVMAATLADGGVNPITGERVISSDACQRTLAVMATAGLYETSGDWLYAIGMPGKSGVGGGIITVAPGKGGLATFAPPLDAAGNSVRGQLAARFLARKLGLNLFASAPWAPPAAD